MWDLKDKNIDNVEMGWSIIEKAPSLKNRSKICELCLTEKDNIIFQKFDLLSQRKDLLNKCQQRNKFLLYHFKDESLTVASKIRHCYKRKPPDNSKKKAAPLLFKQNINFLTVVALNYSKASYFGEFFFSNLMI